jgi:6,7-dimethyl-8-ribityllumazine synthase
MNVKRFLIIESEFNDAITSSLSKGVVKTLEEEGVSSANIFKIHAPGAFELSILAHKAAQTKKWDSIICCGCVIEGDTDHHLYVSQSAAYGLTQASLMNGVPIHFCILTTETIEQAEERAGLRPRSLGSKKRSEYENKGCEAGYAALKTLKAIAALEKKA